MTIPFRFARPDEIADIGRLSAHSFPGPGRDADWWQARFGTTLFGDGPEILWVGEDGGRVVASCQLHRISHYVSGVEIPTMGLGTVAIAPTHRQRGLAGRMVSEALAAARERGDVLSSLYPFRASFYARLGYGLCGDAHQYHLAPRDLPASEERASVEMIAGEGAERELAAFYDAWARTQTGQLKRGERLWRSLLDAQDRLVVGYRAHGSLEGFALASYPTDMPPAERYLSVDEIAWSTPRARRGLYGWLASMGDQWRSLALRALPEHRLEDWLREPRLARPGPPPQWGLWFPSALLLRGPMFRILRFDEAWRLRRSEPEVRLTVEIEVHDEQLAMNEGTRRIAIENGVVEVLPGGGAADLRIEGGISALSRLYMGSLRSSDAVESGLLTADRPERLEALDRALRLPGCWTFDRY